MHQIRGFPGWYHLTRKNARYSWNQPSVVFVHPGLPLFWLYHPQKLTCLSYTYIRTYIHTYEQWQKNRQYEICIGLTLVYGHWLNMLKTHGKRWDLPKLAIPLFKVMLSYFSNIHINDTQIGRWCLWIIYKYIHAAVSCKRYPPKFTIYHYCTNVW